MAAVGDPAPDFTVPVVDGTIGTFALSRRLDEAPLILAFFPAAFSSTCTTEVRGFQERLNAFDDVGATVYGLSTDTPFALGAFREEHALDFDLLSDYDRRVIDAYDAVTDFERLGIHGLAQRVVIVIDEDCRVTYRWDAADPSREPDYDAVLDAARTT